MKIPIKASLEMVLGWQSELQRKTYDLFSASGVAPGFRHHTSFARYTFSVYTWLCPPGHPTSGRPPPPQSPRQHQPAEGHLILSTSIIRRSFSIMCQLFSIIISMIISIVISSATCTRQTSRADDLCEAISERRGQRRGKVTKREKVLEERMQSRRG